MNHRRGTHEHRIRKNRIYHIRFEEKPACRRPFLLAAVADDDDDSVVFFVSGNSLRCRTDSVLRPSITLLGMRCEGGGGGGGGGTGCASMNRRRERRVCDATGNPAENNECLFDALCVIFSTTACRETHKCAPY